MDQEYDPQVFGQIVVAGSINAFGKIRVDVIAGRFCLEIAVEGRTVALVFLDADEAADLADLLTSP